MTNDQTHYIHRCVLQRKYSVVDKSRHSGAVYHARLRARRAIERAISALKYHNFNVRRPVVENGELAPGSDAITLGATYRNDVELLKNCQLLFAVPTGRDPGTLVEIGLAIAHGIPVVVYDPGRECANTMVMAGSNSYSDDLDTCLNATFDCLSRLRAPRE